MIVAFVLFVVMTEAFRQRTQKISLSGRLLRWRGASLHSSGKQSEDRPVKGLSGLGKLGAGPDQPIDCQPLHDTLPRKVMQYIRVT